MNKTFCKITHELSKYKFRMTIVMLALIFTSLSTISFGYILRDLIDRGIAKGNLEMINQSIKYMAYAILALGVGSFFRSYYIYMVSNRVMSDIRQRMFQSLLRQSIERVCEIKTTDYVNRFAHDLNYIGEVIVNILSISLRNAITFLGGAFMMFMVNLKLSLITIAMLPITMVLVKLIGVKIKRYSEKTHSEKSSLEEVISETLHNMHVIYSMNLEAYRLGKMEAQTKKYNRDHESYLRARSSFFAAAIISVTSVILLVIWIGGQDVIKGLISSGDMIAFIFYALISAFSLGSIAEVFGELQKYLTGAARVFEIEEKEDEDQFPKLAKEDYVSKLKLPYKVMFLLHKFSYTTRKNAMVIKNIKFGLYGGEFIGMVGPSGSGKSTILKIMMGIYKANICKFCINDIEVDLSRDNKLRSKIAYIPQDPLLFSTSIEENILLGRDMDEAKLEKVLEVCGLGQIISELPDGIKTYVGERATQLSGGQKQRIAIARSLYGEPEILLMDEATSALDSESEMELLQKLKEFMKDKAVLSIAHRISSIAKADRIIFIKDGKIEAAGPHKTLLRMSPKYAQLVKAYQEY